MIVALLLGLGTLLVLASAMAEPGVNVLWIPGVALLGAGWGLHEARKETQ